MSSVSKKTGVSKKVARDRRILARARKQDDEKPVSEGIKRAAKRAGIKTVPDPIPAAIREMAERQGVKLPRGKTLDQLDGVELAAVAIAATELAEEGARKPSTERGSEMTPEDWEKRAKIAEKRGPLHVELIKLAAQFDQRSDGGSKGIAGCLIICDVIARIADTRAEVYALAARSFGSLTELTLQGRLDRLAELDEAQAATGAS